MKKYAIGLDYGTNSCRSLLVDLADGTELGSTVFNYPTGELGIITDPSDPNVARQNPQDYIDGLEAIVKGVIEQARSNDAEFDPENIIGIGIDTTGSTPIPVDARGTPLALDPAFEGHLGAHAWLWKDHSAHAEAAEITALVYRDTPAAMWPAAERNVLAHLIDLLGKSRVAHNGDFSSNGQFYWTGRTAE